MRSSDPQLIGSNESIIQEKLTIDFSGRFTPAGVCRHIKSAAVFLSGKIGMMNELPLLQRKEFVRQMQQVKIETIRNSVDNGITFDSVPGFENVDFPVIALAGGKEQQSVLDSVKRMAETNNNCRYEIWKKRRIIFRRCFPSDLIRLSRKRLGSIKISSLTNSTLNQ